MGMMKIKSHGDDEDQDRYKDDEYPNLPEDGIVSQHPLQDTLLFPPVNYLESPVYKEHVIKEEQLWLCSVYFQITLSPPAPRG